MCWTLLCGAIVIEENTREEESKEKWNGKKRGD
jgi:hypothetical protein